MSHQPCSVVDPNPKVRIRIRIRIQTLLKNENLCEKSKIKHLKEKNYWKKKFFFGVQVPEHIWKQLEAPFRKNWGQNISLRIRIRIRKKNFVDPNPKKLVRIHNTAAMLKKN
jgi:hypothetical protein